MSVGFTVFPMAFVAGTIWVYSEPSAVSLAVLELPCICAAIATVHVFGIVWIEDFFVGYFQFPLGALLLLRLLAVLVE